MLSALLAEEAEFLVVGAHALGAHGHPRATGDLDVWIRRSPDNAARVVRALIAFGAPLDRIDAGDLESPDLVFQIGVEPSRIDILTSIDGVEFDEAWAARAEVTIDRMTVPLIGVRELIRNKRASGREQDLADVARLEAVLRGRSGENRGE